MQKVLELYFSFGKYINVIVDCTDPDWEQHDCLIDGKTGEMIFDSQG